MKNIATTAIDTSLLPQHIAVVMDGNGRWAQQRMLPRVAGHHQGVATVRWLVEYCAKQAIAALTLFAFSSENWQRPAYEIKTLMALLQKVLAEEVQTMHKNNIRLVVIGDIAALAPALKRAITAAQDLTRNNTGLRLNIAINYSGKWDLTQAMRAMAQDLQDNLITSQQINEELISQYLSLADLAPPDLFIRTSGEQRLSNFLLWQLAYTELYFTDVLWPDFNEATMTAALRWYATRQRRFGAVLPEKLSVISNA